MMGGTWLDLDLDPELELDLLVVKGMEEDNTKNIESQPIHYNNSESSAHPNEPQRAKTNPPVRAADRVVFQ